MPPTEHAPLPPARRRDDLFRPLPGGWTPAAAVAVGAFVYVLAHALIRLAFSDVIAVDWVGETVYAQTLDWGQTPKYPPLPAWALWAVHQVTGPGAVSTLIVKYTVLWAAIMAYFFAARRVLGADGWAVLATVSVLLIFQLAWNAHEGVTHTLFLTLAAPLTLLAVLRLPAAPTVTNYVLLGVAVALGALAKQAYFAGLVALLAAALMQPGYRAALINWRLLLTAATAVCLAGPHYAWAVSSGFDFGTAARTTLSAPGSDTWLAQVASGLVSSIRAPLLFLSPLLPVLLLVVPRAFAPANIVHPGAHGPPGADPVRLVRDALLCGVGVLVVPVLFAGVAHYGERWMHPLMLLGPIYLMAMVRAVRPSARRLRVFIGIILAVSVVALGWRLAGFVYPSPTTCGKCRLAVPYGALAAGLDDMGFTHGTILAADEHIAGNLRTHFPDARVVALNYDYYDPPATGRSGGQCLVVWRSRAGDAEAHMPHSALTYMGLAQRPTGAQIRTFRLPHGHLFLPDDYAVSRFAAVLLPATGRCR